MIAMTIIETIGMKAGEGAESIKALGFKVATFVQKRRECSPEW